MATEPAEMSSRRRSRRLFLMLAAWWTAFVGRPQPQKDPADAPTTRPSTWLGHW